METHISMDLNNQKTNDILHDTQRILTTLADLYKEKHNKFIQIMEQNRDNNAISDREIQGSNQSSITILMYDTISQIATILTNYIDTGLFDQDISDLQKNLYLAKMMHFGTELTMTNPGNIAKSLYTYIGDTQKGLFTMFPGNDTKELLTLSKLTGYAEDIFGVLVVKNTNQKPSISNIFKDEKRNRHNLDLIKNHIGENIHIEPIHKIAINSFIECCIENFNDINQTSLFSFISYFYQDKDLIEIYNTYFIVSGRHYLFKDIQDTTKIQKLQKKYFKIFADAQ